MLGRIHRHPGRYVAHGLQVGHPWVLHTASPLSSQLWRHKPKPAPPTYLASETGWWKTIFPRTRVGGRRGTGDNVSAQGLGTLALNTSAAKANVTASHLCTFLPVFLIFLCLENYLFWTPTLPCLFCA